MESSADGALSHQRLSKIRPRQTQCTDCHSTVKELVHPSGLPPAQCASCHKAEAKQYAGSIHGMSKAMGASAAATCVDCHGSHDMQPVKHADSPVFKLNLPRTCAKCHSNAGITAEYRMKYPQVASAIHRQHSRPGAAANGPDRGAVVQ
jgi:cytochrome c553